MESRRRTLDILNCTAKRLAELKPNTLLAGIDIGKKQHACIVMDLRAKVLTRFKLSNSRQGFERLLEKVEATRREAQADHLLFGMEPTGHYWRNLAYFLDEQEFRFHLVNPFTLKRHREGQDLSRTKNDYRDAAMVAELLRTGKFTLTRLTYGPWADLPYRIPVGAAHFRPLQPSGGRSGSPEESPERRARLPLPRVHPGLQGPLGVDRSGCALGLPRSPQDKREEPGEICISGPGGI